MSLTPREAWEAKIKEMGILMSLHSSIGFIHHQLVEAIYQLQDLQTVTGEGNAQIVVVGQAKETVDQVRLWLNERITTVMDEMYQIQSRLPAAPADAHA
jgi:hypothetical protein